MPWLLPSMKWASDDSCRPYSHHSNPSAEAAAEHPDLRREDATVGCSVSPDIEPRTVAENVPAEQAAIVVPLVAGAVLHPSNARFEAAQLA